MVTETVHAVLHTDAVHAGWAHGTCTGVDFLAAYAVAFGPACGGRETMDTFTSVLAVINRVRLELWAFTASVAVSSESSITLRVHDEPFHTLALIAIRVNIIQFTADVSSFSTNSTRFTYWPARRAITPAISRDFSRWARWPNTGWPY